MRRLSLLDLVFAFVGASVILFLAYNHFRLSANHDVLQASLPFEVIAALRGNPKARDGDDLEFGEVRVRLRGIAAPEWRANMKNEGGQEAMDHLNHLINGHSVSCFLDGSTAGSSYRPVAICFVGEVDLGYQMVRAGHALDCPAYSLGMYTQPEALSVKDGNELRKIYELPEYCLE